MAARSKAKAKKSDEEILEENLSSALETVHKMLGKGAMGTARGVHSIRVDVGGVISSGSIGLNDALGVGGYPHGRITEIFGNESSGKTTLALTACASAQKKGLIAAFIDAEHALDPVYAEALGVDLDKLLISQPNTGEEALEIVDTLLDSDGVGIIVVDSVAALIPKAELEGDMGQSHPGLQARLMSQALRKMAGRIHHSEAVVIFINQIRHKIGVMFGCFSYNTRVTLADGSQEKIGKIVNQKMAVDVMSFNSKTGEMSPQRVVDWHDNGRTDHFVRVVAASAGGGNGRCTFAATEDHVVYTTAMQEVRVGDLQVGGKVLTRGDLAFNGSQRIVAISQILGDGSVRRNGLRSHLRVTHGWKQRDYCKWKEGLFGDIVSGTEVSHGKTYGFNLAPSCDLLDVLDGPELIKEAGVAGVALWYLDDGTFGGTYARWGWGKASISVSRWSQAQLEEAAEILRRMGLPKPTASKGRLLWSGKRSRDFMERIAPFVPRCMKYKVHPKFHAELESSMWDRTPERRSVLIPTEIKEIRRVLPEGRATHRYDLSVENTHGYLVDGVAVHNSPKTTSGGNALKFYASVRLEVTRIGSIKKGDDIVANKTKVKVVKNKVAPPFLTTEFNIAFGKGISWSAEVLQRSVAKGLLKKSGSWYSRDGVNLACGLTAICDKIESDPELEAFLREGIGAGAS